MELNISAGKKHEREIVSKSIDWCLKRFRLDKIYRLKINVVVGSLSDCDGYCTSIDESTNRSFKIAISNEQSLRDFVMTIVHEMIHVKQYARNEWMVDGEPEAWGIQEMLTDELWKSGKL